MAAQRRNVFTAGRREIYLTGCWTTYRFQLGLDAGRLESILKVVHYRGVEGMRRPGNNASVPRSGYLTSRHSEVILPEIWPMRC